MPNPKYTGSPMGSGNPPGAYSKGYLDVPGDQEGHFVKNASYRGDMHVGVPERATEVGNQPKTDTTISIEKHTNGPALR